MCELLLRNLVMSDNCRTFASELKNKSNKQLKQSNMEYNSCDFFEAVKNYGELEHSEIMAITDNKPIIIDGKEVDSILDDDGLKFSYIENGVAYSRRLKISDIDEEICDKIYEFLCDNKNGNLDFFNGL